MEVMVYSEDIKTFRELVSAGESLNANRITGVFIGKEEDAEEVGKYCDKLFFISLNDVGEYSPLEYADAIYNAIKSSDPQILLVGGTPKGVPIASMISVLVGEPCATEVIEMKLSEDGLIVKRSDLGGIAISEVRVGKKLFDKISSPKVVCVKPGFYPVFDSKKKGEIERLKPEINRRTEVLEIKEKERGEGFEDADVIVVAGRGVKKREDLGMIEELAKVLGGVVGVTRPLSADLHWAPTWVGMSGVPVKPKLYVGVGVSGQIQHIAGIRNSKVIVAVNIDPNAPIFEHADYGIIGDLYQVVPKLIEMLKE